MSKGSDDGFVSLSFERARRSYEDHAVEYLKEEAGTEVTRDEDEDLVDALIRAYAELHEQAFETEATLAGYDFIYELAKESPHVEEPAGFRGSKVIETPSLIGTDTVIVVGEDALSDNPVSPHVRADDGNERFDFTASEYLPFVVTRPEGVAVVNV